MVGRACVGAGVFVCTYTVIMCMNVWLCKHACFHHIYMFSVCLHVRMFWGGAFMCLCGGEGGKSRPKFWNKVAWPAAVTDRLLCSFSTLVVFFKQFPLRHPPTSPTLTEKTHTETPCILFYPVVAHSLYRTYCFQRENSVHLKERRWKRFNDL